MAVGFDLVFDQSLLVLEETHLGGCSRQGDARADMWKNIGPMLTNEPQITDRGVGNPKIGGDPISGAGALLCL